MKLGLARILSVCFLSSMAAFVLTMGCVLLAWGMIPSPVSLSLRVGGIFIAILGLCLCHHAWETYKHVDEPEEPGRSLLNE